jgi:hypothetical protein
VRAALRAAAVLIAVAGVVDPAVSTRTAAPLAVEFRVPPPSDPHYAEAIVSRDAMRREMQGESVIDGSLSPHAVIAIGNAELNGTDSARIVAVPISAATPNATVVGVNVPRRTLAGQTADVKASIRGAGAAGRVSTIALEVEGTVLHNVQHTWADDDERFDPMFTVAPPAPGVYRLRVRVSTDGAEASSVADAVLVATDAPVRVFAYEPRPSWPVAFVRRSLEADTLFEVASTTRTSRPAATTTAETPRLADVDPDRFGLLLVGALDDLRESDLDVLDRFVTTRGGTLLLVPDRKIPASLRQRFDLPPFDEVLLEKPLAVQGTGTSLMASELLLTPPRLSMPLASVKLGDRSRTVIAAVDRGEGRVILSGALDAWRFRANADDGFGSFWRALVADAALAAPPKVDVQVDPPIARPGDDLTVSVTVRATELVRTARTTTLPPVSATVVDETGRVRDIRLWPGTRPGMLSGRLQAPSRGRYMLAASMNGTSTTVPLLVADDVVHAAREDAPANAYAAGATGGVVATGISDVMEALADIDRGSYERTVRPMRSVWWIVPFAGLLCSEWAWRRRRGLK